MGISLNRAITLLNSTPLGSIFNKKYAKCRTLSYINFTFSMSPKKKEKLNIYEHFPIHQPNTNVTQPYTTRKMVFTCGCPETQKKTDQKKTTPKKRPTVNVLCTLLNKVEQYVFYFDVIAHFISESQSKRSIIYRSKKCRKREIKYKSPAAKA